MTTTKSKTNLNVLNTAYKLVSSGAVRLHWDSSEDSIKFRNLSNTIAKYGLTKKANFVEIVQAINTVNPNGFGGEFSCSLTGVMAIAIAITYGGNVTVNAINRNDERADAFFAKYFNNENVSLSEYAYHSWRNLDGDETVDEIAAYNYQRRIRNTVDAQSKSQTAYVYLAANILRNMINNGGTFVPAREDFRAAARVVANG